MTCAVAWLVGDHTMGAYVVLACVRQVVARNGKQIKYEKLYLFELADGNELFELCQDYITFYNQRWGIHRSKT